MSEAHPRRFGALTGCLIYVASLCLAARASAESSAKVVKGPYLQALASTSVEIRTELDTPAPISIESLRLPTPEPDAAYATTARPRCMSSAFDGLLPSTRYSYSLAVGSNLAKGTFTTAPPPDSTAPFTFLVYGDNRTDDTAHAAIVRMMTETPSDFLLNTGDLVQDGASAPNWQSFFDIEASLIRDRNVFACVGNHEITDGAGANYLRYFGPTSDAHGNGENPKLYGSFRWGEARFFLLDAMETFDSGSERAWLDDELTRADSETGLVWRIVVLHQSPWSAGPHGGNPRALHAGIPALFASHHVDLVIAGHDHIYERGFAPVVDRAGLGSDALSGIRYIVSGGGGAPLYTVDHPLPSTRKVEAVHHIVEVTVQSDAVRLVTRRDDGSVLERCGMTKAHDGWDCDPLTPSPAKPLPSSSSPSSSRWGCSASPASPSLTPALVALGLVGPGLRRALRRRRNPR